MPRGGLWVDAHRPRSLKDLTFHPELTERLRAVATAADMPHLLVYGPPGSGRKTRVTALLREMFGASADKLKLERRTFKTPGGKVIDLSMLGSAHHLELNPADVGMYDRLVVQEIIKEIAQSTNVASAAGAGAGAGAETTPERRPFKVVLLTDADRMTKQAQHGLRRTMEKYAASCRIIMMCESLSKIIEPVRSRCLAIRVPAPSVDQVADTVKRTCDKELVRASPNLVSSIARGSNRNVRRALLMAEACRVQAASAVLGDDVPVQVPDWERYIALMAKDIIGTQTPMALLDVRTKLYELLSNCIPPELIFRTLATELARKVEDSLKHEIFQLAAQYEARLAGQGSKPIYHLEAFVAKFMARYKEYLMSMFA